MKAKAEEWEMQLESVGDLDTFARDTVWPHGDHNGDRVD